MRIAIDARSLEGSKTGVGRYLENLLKEWKERRDVQFLLYFKDEIPQKDYLQNSSFVLKRLKNPLGFSSNFFFQHILLPYNLKKDRADFFFSPFYLRPLFCPVRSAIVLHDISYEAHPEWFDRKSQFILKTLSKISARKADIIFTVSEYSKSEIMKYYGIDESKIIVTPLAPDGSFRREGADKTEEIKKKCGLSGFVLNVGTIFTRRHVVEMIEAFDRFLEKNKGCQLLIVGRDKTYPLQDIDGRIEEVNSKHGGNRIKRLDSVTEDELMALYSACEAVIYLSDYEGFGLPVVEGQFFGKPVITSHNTSLVEVGGDSVEYAEGNSANGIYASLTKVLCDNEYRRFLVLKGADNINRFSWQKSAATTLGEILRNAK